MNNAVLLQVAGAAEYLKLVSLYYGRHAEYCEKYGFDYIVHGAPVHRWGDQPWIGWGKLAIMQELALQGYEYIVYLDADAYISDMDTDLRVACVEPFNMVRWWSSSPTLSHLQAGVIYLHSLKPGPDGICAYSVISMLLQESKYYVDRFPYMRGWYEQGQINEYANHEWYKHIFHELPMPYNWGVLSHEECANPIIRAFHGERPFDALYKRIKESIENEPNV